MKKRLGLLLVSVISTLSMIMGMSTMAYAAEWEPQTIDCGNDVHKNIVHFYVTNPEPQCSLDSGQHYVIGYILTPNESSQPTCVYYPELSDDNKIDLFVDSQLNGTGWYYKDCNNNDKFTKCPPPVVEAEPSSAAHTHDYHWQTIVEPTKDQDGLESEVCVCGATRNIQRIPAMGFTLTEYATPMVVNAIPGQTVEMEFGE